MPDVEGRGIFVSYRRSDSSYLAGRLSDRLVDRFGPDQVFIDVDTIEPGADFGAEIRRAVATCKVLLAVISPNWLDATDDRGRRRIDDPDDVVRLEIEAALTRDVRVIPILMDGAVMPTRRDLPDGLASLAGRNALAVRYDTFRSDAGRLIRVIERVLGVSLNTGADASTLQAATGTSSDDAASESVAVATVSDARDLVLEAVGERKTQVIAVVRRQRRLGLREATDLVEAAPTRVLEAVSEEAALRAMDELMAAGASATVKDARSSQPGTEGGPADEPPTVHGARITASDEQTLASTETRGSSDPLPVTMTGDSKGAPGTVKGQASSNGKLRWISKVAMVLAVAASIAAIGLALRSSMGGNTGAVVTVQRDIPATQVWTDMNLHCASGDNLQIAVSGTVMHEDSARGEVGPTGLTDPRYHRWNVPGLPDANTVAVIGSLDQALPLFVVGNGTTYTCPREGALFLGVNDIGVQNNSGKFTAKITKTHSR